MSVHRLDHWQTIDASLHSTPMHQNPTLLSVESCDRYLVRLGWCEPRCHTATTSRLQSLCNRMHLLVLVMLIRQSELLREYRNCHHRHRPNV